MSGYRSSGTSRSRGHCQAYRVDAVLDLAGREVGWPGCGELRQVGLEPMDRVQAEEGGKAFIAGVRDKRPSRLTFGWAAFLAIGNPLTLLWPRGR